MPFFLGELPDMELKPMWHPVSFKCEMLSHIPTVPEAVKPKKDIWGKPIPRGTPHYERKREEFVRRRQKDIEYVPFNNISVSLERYGK
eukprot:1112239-Prorocentrum_minimum.AAC.1